MVATIKCADCFAVGSIEKLATSSLSWGEQESGKVLQGKGKD
jgi:hypothetical protein